MDHRERVVVRQQRAIIISSSIIQMGIITIHLRPRRLLIMDIMDIIMIPIILLLLISMAAILNVDVLPLPLIIIIIIMVIIIPMVIITINNNIIIPKVIIISIVADVIPDQVHQSATGNIYPDVTPIRLYSRNIKCTAPAIQMVVVAVQVVPDLQVH